MITEEMKKLLGSETLKRLNVLDKFDYGPEPKDLKEREYKEITVVSNGSKYYGEVIKGTNIREGKGIGISTDGRII